MSESLQNVKLGKKTPLRVAAYCRISALEEREDGSYETQREFFRSEIEAHEGWVLAEIYGDYAKSGSETQHRKGFLQMMEDAKDGKFDYIITKAVARFARNCADSLDSLRKLKSYGCHVFFMDDGLDTANEAVSELILTAYSTVAELELENIRNSIVSVKDALYEQGKPPIPAKYGYRKDGDQWIICPSEARMVKLAFLLYAQGLTYKKVAERMNEVDGEKTWTHFMIQNAVKNEAYIGDILSYKTITRYTPEGRKVVKNKGLKDQVYIEGHHDPIVGRPLFEAIQKKQKHLYKQLAAEDPYLDEVRDLL